MFERSFSLLLGFLLWSGAPLLEAQTTEVPSAPSQCVSTLKPVPTDSASASQAEDSSATSQDEDNQPFMPHWTGQAGFTYSTSPTQQGQGQITKELNFTGTYNFTEGGDYTSAELAGGQQLVEGVNTNYGELTLEGGLGIGSFLPTLTLEDQQGSSDLIARTVTTDLNFQIVDPVELGFTFSGGTNTHQGPVSSVSSTSKYPDKIVQIDSHDLLGGLILTLVPLDFETLTLTGEDEYDNTDDIQNITHTINTKINQADQIASAILVTETTLFKDYILELAIQAGTEYFPKGTVYSPILAKTVTFAAPTSSNFTAYTFGVMMNFD